MDLSNDIENNTDTNKRGKARLFVSVLVLITALFFWLGVIRSPQRQEPVVIHITKGDSIKSIANQLKEKNVVRAPLFLQSMVAFIGSDKEIELGDYLFESRMSLFRVAYMLAKGVHGIDPVRVTIPEGSNNSMIVEILLKKIPNFDASSFANKIADKEGYLFPDTYFIYPFTTPDEIIEMLSDTFQRRTKKALDIGYKNYTKEEIIVMASIVEKEAASEKDAPIIAGILWKRIEKGMPLQADAAPITYKEKGLPDKPITNPGLVSINATIHPEISDYLFYLHDKSGTIHLAKTFDEHKNNINKYLR